VIAVTSLERGGGSSTLTANLAVVAAEVGLRVLVADANPQVPRQHELFGLPNRQGLSSVVREAHDVAALVQPTAFPRLRLLPAGPPLQDRGEAVQMYLGGVSRLGELADLVLVDSPPISAGADVGLLAALTDAVVLLVRAGSTTPRQLRGALDGLDALGVGVLGLVLTMRSKRKRDVSWYAVRGAAMARDGGPELAGHRPGSTPPPPVDDGTPARGATPSGERATRADGGGPPPAAWAPENAPPPRSGSSGSSRGPAKRSLGGSEGSEGSGLA
jgi:Mrp family chromosome partitioning ATPase